MVGKKPPLAVLGSQSTGIQPPRKLGAPGRALWDAIQSDYEISDMGGIETLMQICLAQDRVEALAERISADGETIRSRTGIKSHPAIRDELAARAFIVRTLAKLGISLEEVKPVGRPPGRGGWRGWED